MKVESGQLFSSNVKQSSSLINHSAQTFHADREGDHINFTINRPMGGFFGLFQRWFWQRETRCLILGLDNAGKTTILKRLRLGSFVDTNPTIGFNVETISYPGLSIKLWDVGGQEHMRPLWRHYFPGTHALIFVIDASDADRVPEAHDELQRLLAEDALRDAVLLVFANKQDLEHRLTPPQITERLRMDGVVDRPWAVKGACGVTGDGLAEGFDWVRAELSKTA
jgi:small GTP-binding protein